MKIQLFDEYFNESLNSNINIKNIGDEYSQDLIDMIYGLFDTYGTAKIGLFNGEKLIGGVLLEEDYLPREYRFDIVIDEKYRGKGYLKLLMDKLIENFNNDKDAKQLSATVVNKKLTDILVDKYGFNKGEYGGEDFLWINK